MLKSLKKTPDKIKKNKIFVQRRKIYKKLTNNLHVHTTLPSLFKSLKNGRQNLSFLVKENYKLTTNLRVLTSYIATLIERVPTHYPLHVLYTHT